jgi:hypothetical protein
MKKSTEGVSWSPVIFLLLAALFAFLSIRASKLTVWTMYKSYAATKIDLHWVFWLTSALTIVFLLPVINYVLRELHNRSLLPKSFDVLYQEQFREKVKRIVMTLRGKMHSLGGQFLAVGLAILVVIGFISKTPLLRDREVNNNLNEWFSGVLGTLRSSDKPVSVFQIPLNMDTQDRRQYLKNCLEIVQDLADVGVKAVLIDARGMEFFHTEEEFKLVKELDKSGIVVVGARDFYGFPKEKFSKGVYTLPEDERRISMSQARIEVLGRRNPQGTADVTLELLRRFHNYPSDLVPQQEGSTVLFGDYQIPVTRAGWMYSRDRWGEITFWPRVYAFQGQDTDTVKYQIMRNGVVFRTDLNDLRQEFMGKIVIVGRVVESGLESFMFCKIHAAALENIIQGSVTRKIEIHPLWLTALCLAISGLLAYRFRPSVSMLLIFLFGICLLIVDAVLYDKANLLVEIIYPLLATVMTMVIFPALSFVHRFGNAETSW